MLAARSFVVLLCLVALGACSYKPYPPEPPAAMQAAAGQADQPAEPEAMAEPQAAAVPQLAPPATAALAVPPVAAEPAPTVPALTVPALSAAPAPSSEPVGTYPYGTAQPAAAAPSPPASPGTSVAAAESMAPAPPSGPEIYTIISPDTGEPVVQPYSSGWVNPQKNPEQVQADIEGCYRYAWSQVEHDMRIEDDVAAARGDSDQGLGFADLTRRMNLFEHKNRRTELINDCMESKGYTRG